MKTVLSVDGGGVRGILPAYFLLMIQLLVNELLQNSPLSELVGKWRFKDVFDVIVGTSTGSIIAAALCLPDTHRCTAPATGGGTVELKGPISPSRLVKIYYDEASTIFPYTILKVVRQLFQNLYDAGPLEQVLKTYLGGLGNALPARLSSVHDSRARFMACAYDLNNQRPRIFFSYYQEQNSQVPIDEEETVKGLAFKKTNFPLWQVCRASSAAPTYLPSAELAIKIDEKTEETWSFVDGGMFANNPVMVGIGGLAAVFDDYQALEKPFVLSLGTGQTTQAFKIGKNAGVAGWGADLINVAFDGQSEIVHQMQKLMFKDLVRYFRFQCDFPGDNLALDDSDEQTMNTLLKAAQERIESKEYQETQLVEKVAAEIVSQLSARLQDPEFKTVLAARESDWPPAAYDKCKGGLDWWDKKVTTRTSSSSIWKMIGL